jgi:hypothetical protein
VLVVTDPAGSTWVGSDFLGDFRAAGHFQAHDLEILAKIRSIQHPIHHQQSPSRRVLCQSPSNTVTMVSRRIVPMGVYAFNGAPFGFEIVRSRTFPHESQCKMLRMADKNV